MVQGGDPLGVHRRDREYRWIEKKSGKQHREGRFGDGEAYVQGYANERSQIRHWNHTDLWTGEGLRAADIQIMEEPKGVAE